MQTPWTIAKENPCTCRVDEDGIGTADCYEYDWGWKGSSSISESDSFRWETWSLIGCPIFGFLFAYFSYLKAKREDSPGRDPIADLFSAVGEQLQ